MIPINEYSRPGKKLDSVKAIVIHWPDAAAWSAEKLYNYFATGAPAEKRYASTQFIVGLNGEVVQVMPEDERAYHCGSKTYTEKSKELFGEYATNPKLSPNACTIGIEVCHFNNAGDMTHATTRSLADFVAGLCKKYNLDPLVNVLRHYDVVGWKKCPRYWCNNPDDWSLFLDTIRCRMEKQ